MMSFPTAVKTCLSKYVTFSGRASRAEYWWFQLVVLLLLLVMVVLSAVPSTATGVVSLILTLAYVGLWLPLLAVSVRRLHDRNYSGWHLLWSLVPFGGLVLLVWFCMDGTKGENRFGPDPIAANVVEVF
ncbi:MAG TPA: DUF805 domain-containing protein [Reyranella sp.]|nr:DUF805 domain-containing protein [Reyranella sp.]